MNGRIVTDVHDKRKKMDVWTSIQSGALKLLKYASHKHWSSSSLYKHPDISPAFLTAVLESTSG